MLIDELDRHGQRHRHGSTIIVVLARTPPHAGRGARCQRLPTGKQHNRGHWRATLHTPKLMVLCISAGHTFNTRKGR